MKADELYPDIAEAVRERRKQIEETSEISREVSLSDAMSEMAAWQDKAMPQLFLSYAREDKEKVEKLYQKLSDAGFKPWMDTKDILPGERWKSSTQKAILRSDFFLVCLSANSIDKRGWIQREIKKALDIWQEKLEDDIYLIPVRLEDREGPESLCDFQPVDLFEKDGWTRLLKAIQVGIERRGEAIKPVAQESTLSEPYLTRDEPSPSTEMVESRPAQGGQQSAAPSERLWRVLSHVWRDVPTRLILIITLISLTVALGVTLYFSRTTITSERISPSTLGYTIEYPSQLVVGEDEQFSITLVNSSSVSLTQVSATLVFSDVLPISSDTTVAQFEDLAPGERKTRTIHFTLNQYIAPTVQAELRASADQFRTVPLERYTLNVALFPWLKTLGSKLVGFSLTGLGGILLWMLRGAFKDVLPGK